MNGKCIFVSGMSMIIWLKQSQMKINIVIDHTHDTNRLLCSFLFMINS